MRTSAEGASEAGNTARIWQRGATRRAILDAARLVAARVGTDFSLNTVAKEAGYSPTTIFAYFATKNDLLNAVVADDLAALARAMRDSYPFTVVAETKEEQPAETIEAADAPVEITPEPVQEVLQTEPEPLAAAAVIAAASEEPPAVAPQPEAKPGTAPEAAKEPPRVDAWLERRLRVFEKTLADVESRLA